MVTQFVRWCTTGARRRTSSRARTMATASMPGMIASRDGSRGWAARARARPSRRRAVPAPVAGQEPTQPRWAERGAAGAERSGGRGGGGDGGARVEDRADAAEQRRAAEGLLQEHLGREALAARRDFVAVARHVEDRHAALRRDGAPEREAARAG